MDGEDATGLAQTQAGAERRQPPARRDAPPVFGRYVVVRRLGEGGMGVVWLARDPQLDRDVAIKVVRQSGRDPADSARRLRREAQALAQLSDPHVVHVFDVGDSEDSIWIAMELVDGDNLERWAQMQPRSTAEIVAVFVQAGHGLQAAHTAGILHRDFKPSNVMIGRDGVARVLDFGLARALAGAPEKVEASAPIGDPLDTLRSSVTKSGAMVGTPAYMAPEQIRGQKLDRRTDVFAFCVALFETLYGERPFQGEQWPQLASAILSGRIADPPRRRRVPAALHTIVVRGLERDPAHRWPSMSELITALAPWQERRRRAIVPGFVGLALVGTVVAFLARDEDDACVSGERRIAAAWSSDRRAEVSDALAGVDATVREGALARLDDWVRTWREQLDATCHVDDPAARARVACLARVEHGFGATTDLLREADARVLLRVDDLVLALPPATSCADADGTLGLDVDPAFAVERADIEAILARSEALDAAGRYGDALAAAREAVVRADDHALAGMRARALERVGIVSEKAGAYADGLAALEQAYAAAADARDDRTSARTAIRISYLLANKFDALDEAERWLHQADAWVRRVDDAEITASHSHALAAWHHASGDFAAAQEEYERALAQHIALHGEDHPTVQDVRHDLVRTLVARGDYERALTVSRVALESRERMYSANHPLIALSLNTTADSLIELDREDEARELYERSRDILLASVGPDSALLLNAYDNLAVVAYQQQRWTDARAFLRQSLDLRARTLGEDHPDQAHTLLNLGNLANTQGNGREAQEWYDKALASRERAAGADHPEVGLLLHNMAAAFARQDEFTSALPLLRRSLSIRERTLPADHPHLFGTRKDFALSAIEVGEFEEARAVLDRASAHVPSSTNKSQRVQLELFVLETLLGRGRTHEALALARKLHDRIEAEPTYAEEVRAHARFGLARALEQANGPSSAVQALGRAALAEAPADTRIRDHIAEWLEQPVPAGSRAVGASDAAARETP